MQKVRSYYLNFTWAAYKTTILRYSLTVLCIAIAYILYLALEEDSPLYFLFKQVCTPLYFKAFLLSFTLLVESHLISIPEANKIFQFTSFIYWISTKSSCYN